MRIICILLIQKNGVKGGKGIDIITPKTWIRKKCIYNVHDILRGLQLGHHPPPPAREATTKPTVQRRCNDE